MQLLRVARRINIKKDTFVFHTSDQKGQECFLVESGKLLLTLGSGKMKEYGPGDLFGEISVLNQRPRMGSIRAQSETSLITFDGSKLYDTNDFDPKTTLEIVLGLTSHVIKYLDEAEFQQASINLLPKGESVSLEFKESLSKTIKKKVVETICAFFNTRGGVILLGVNDDAEVVGLKVPTPKVLDQYELSIIHIIKKKVGIHFATYLTFNQEKIDGKLILRINCGAPSEPAIFQQAGKEVFYVRIGAS
ncbi:MAG: RNA-binding domain-containing protein, partial [Bacteroidota bacterium]